MSRINLLIEKGLRPTSQLLLIINLILDKVAHLTAEDIIKHVQNQMPGFSKSTVCRTL